MESKEKNVVRILSTAYLYRKNHSFPTKEEINAEMERRERWLKLIDDKYSGEEGFLQVLREIYNDPPDNFT